MKFTFGGKMIPINDNPWGLKREINRRIVEEKFTFSVDLINRFQNGFFESFFFSINSQ
jgi:hypothetical protein